MYATCLFCHADLGRNEVIEPFPVGRRLAFDAGKGRLWVVCRACERWNLTPLEERWEAIEECERLFTSTRTRVSTDNIGLAKLREGLELVRIGGALRPEIAAWRYGDQFGRRRRRHLILTGAGIAAVVGLVAIGPATGIVAGGGWGSWQLVNGVRNFYQHRRIRVRLRVPGTDRLLPLRKRQVEGASIVRADDAWALRVPRGGGHGRRVWNALDEEEQSVWAGGEVLFKGPEALRAASRLLPAINESGARALEVQSAVEIVSEAGEPGRLFDRYTSQQTITRRKRTTTSPGHVIHRLPTEVRLALEMASHEEQERRALEGELAILEAAWRDAEEIARIADDMFVSDETSARLEALRTKV